MKQHSETFSITSLGCAKNLVNSEQMVYLMQEAPMLTARILQSSIPADLSTLPRVKPSTAFWNMRHLSLKAAWAGSL